MQTNKTLQTLKINGEIPVHQFRDGTTTQLDLSSRGYKVEDAIVIASLLQVLIHFFFCSLLALSFVLVYNTQRLSPYNFIGFL